MDEERLHGGKMFCSCLNGWWFAATIFYEKSLKQYLLTIKKLIITTQKNFSFNW